LSAAPTEQMLQGEQDVEDCEVQLVHAERQAYIGRMCPVLLLFLAIAFTPQLAHLQTCCLSTALAILLTILNTAMMLSTSDKKLLIKRAVLVENINHAVRTLVHVLFLKMHNESVFLRLVSLFLQPLSAACQCHSIRSFKAYLAVHILLTIYRFSREVEEGLPWVFATLISISILLEIATQKRNGEEARSSLDVAYKTIGQLAETSSLRMLRSFCDAVAVVDKDLKILEPSPSLSTVLSRKINPGTSMTDLIHMSECQQFVDHMANLQEASCDKHCSEDESEISGCSNQSTGKHLEDRARCLETMKVHLVDGHSGLVAVHLFNVCLMEPDMRGSTGLKYLVGISESWKPPSQKPKMKRRGSGSKQVLHEFNIKTGQIDPMFPAFPPKESEAPLAALCSPWQLNSLHRAGTKQDRTAKVQQRSSSVCPNGSPRPANASASLRVH